MNKPARLELNNSGAWKLLARFGLAAEDAADAIMNAAETLAKAVNDPACGRTALVSLRISTDDTAPPSVLAHWTQAEGWRDVQTGEAS